jgi:hypothetical protein
MGSKLFLGVRQTPLQQGPFELANINWNAKSQLPVFADAAGKPVPFNERAITGSFRCDAETKSQPFVTAALTAL